jgi:hypothetical protein
MKLFLFSSMLLTPFLSNAQFTDSLKITAGSSVTAAAEGYQPLWMKANRFGTISDQKVDLSTHIKLSDHHIMGRGETSLFYIKYAVDIYNNNHFKEIFAKEAFLKAGYKNWELRGGRYEEVLGEVDPQLSSGSFGISGNALPIPKIGVAVTKFTNIPFTKGLLQFKGHYVHGWLGKDQYVKNAYLHEKSFYLKLGRDHLNVYGGIIHFAEWGGQHPQGQTPDRFKDYLRIITGGRGNGSDPVYQQGPVDVANAVGNHLIITDFGASFKLLSSTFRLYTQTIFDKGKGDSSNVNKRDKLVLLNALGPDRLIGLSWESSKKPILSKVVLELINTKDQGGNVIYNGRYNYYNNGVYMTGWNYKDRIIGTPLFINKTDIKNYSLDQSGMSGWNVESNRVSGFHIGLKGNISSKVSYRALGTYLKHYGNYYNDSVFQSGKKQSNFLVEAAYRLNTALFLSFGIAQDFGQLSDNTGAMLKIEYKLVGK